MILLTAYICVAAKMQVWGCLRLHYHNSVGRVCQTCQYDFTVKAIALVTLKKMKHTFWNPRCNNTWAMWFLYFPLPGLGRTLTFYLGLVSFSLSLSVNTVCGRGVCETLLESNFHSFQLTHGANIILFSLLNLSLWDSFHLEKSSYL